VILNNNNVFTLFFSTILFLFFFIFHFSSKNRRVDQEKNWKKDNAYLEGIDAEFQQHLSKGLMPQISSYKQYFVPLVPDSCLQLSTSVFVFIFQ